jgi:hypothetical protein
LSIRLEAVFLSAAARATDGPGGLGRILLIWTIEAGRV